MFKSMGKMRIIITNSHNSQRSHREAKFRNPPSEGWFNLQDLLDTSSFSSIPSTNASCSPLVQDLLFGLGV